jgi:hypothetical protein
MDWVIYYKKEKKVWPGLEGLALMFYVYACHQEKEEKRMLS